MQQKSKKIQKIPSKGFTTQMNVWVGDKMLFQVDPPLEIQNQSNSSRTGTCMCMRIIITTNTHTFRNPINLIKIFKFYSFKE